MLLPESSWLVSRLSTLLALSLLMPNSHASEWGLAVLTR
jgi:hypothetical protein